MKQTAVEWLEQEIFRRYKFAFQQLNCGPLEEAIEQAKEMEKEQQRYSEEEVKNIVDETIEKFYLHLYDLTKAEMKEEWFKQFKKK